MFAEAQGKKGAAGLIRPGSFSQLEIGGALLLPGEGGLQYFEEQPVVLLCIVVLRSIGIEQRGDGGGEGVGGKTGRPSQPQHPTTLLLCSTALPYLSFTTHLYSAYHLIIVHTKSLPSPQDLFLARLKL